jgi:hypothetical protein
MISGRQTLASIDRALSEQRPRMDEVERRVATTNAAMVELRRADAVDFRKLAEVRVGRLAADRVAQHLDQAEAQVGMLLDQRDGAARDLGKRIEGVEVERASLESERATQAGEVDHAAEALDEAEARVQQRLNGRPAYQAQRERAGEAERIAAHAEEKAASSERDQEEKGSSYNNDPLFSYLWKRRYGTPEYRANSLTRWLDGKVARLIGFADARANYARLVEIPVRLRAHADALRVAAEAEFEALEALEGKAREEDGVPGLEERLTAEQSKLDAIDERIEAVRIRQQELLTEKAGFASGDDDYTRQAIEYLAGEFRRDNLEALLDEARATPFPDDDVIVSRIVQRNDERQQLGATLAGLKESLDQHRRRLQELEAIRSDFKRKRFDRAGGSFGDEALIGLMLANFLNGVLDRKALWKTFEQHYRYRPRRADPVFGSGGFGRGTTWGGGMRGPARSGGVGGGRGGGFRTGGGF